MPFLHRRPGRGDAAVVAAGAATARAVRARRVDGDPRVHVLDAATSTVPARPPRSPPSAGWPSSTTPGTAAGCGCVGEVDFGATDRDWLEWQRYEAVLNDALADWPLWGLCLFDTRRLPEPRAGRPPCRRTRTSRLPGGPAPQSARSSSPADYLRSLPVPDEPLESTEPVLAVTDVDDFAALRHAVARALAPPARRGPDLAEDFLLAVDEMTSNAIRHGAPPVSLRLWTADDRVVCTIEDGGPGWDDPFAGYGPAHGEDLSRGGMGLWLARQLCDHVDIAGDPARGGGVRVRLTTRLT